MIQEKIATDISAYTIDAVKQLPIKVIQFGTGVLLRGLPDYFIDIANKAGQFNGKILVVKSTEKGDTIAFDKQNGAYTICERGLLNGQSCSNNIVNQSIEKVLSATQQWHQILQYAAQPEVKTIISNTTEVGIVYDDNDVINLVPVSFPGRVLAILKHRYSTLGNSKSTGMIILPTELISNNGQILKSIVLQIAAAKNETEEFITWLQEANHFCNTLVDRIVPGVPAATIHEQLEDELGYKDELLIIAEPFKLWVIEGDDSIEKELGFLNKELGCFVVPDLNVYKELKLRLLNATHTFSCALAHLQGFTTVAESLLHEPFRSFVEKLLYTEIATSIPYTIDENIIKDFANKVLERFANPTLNHNWLSISLNFTAKIKMRCVALIKQYIKNNNTLPQHMVSGFAAYIAFMKPAKVEAGKYFGEANAKLYEINDSEAHAVCNYWKNENVTETVTQILSDEKLWGKNLNAIPYFATAIAQQVEAIMNNEFKL